MHKNSTGFIHQTKKLDLTDEQLKKILQTYDRYAASYAKKWEWSDLWERGMKKFLNTFFKYVESKSTLLVAGCGTGRDLALFARKGYRCLGIDFSTGMLREAAKYVNAPLEHMDIRKLKFMDNTFDAIFCDSALEHIPKAQFLEVLRGFSRVLKPNGILAFGLKKGNGKVIEDLSLKESRYCTTYTERETKGLIKQTEFEILEIFSLKAAHTGKPNWIEVFLRNSA